MLNSIDMDPFVYNPMVVDFDLHIIHLDSLEEIVPCDVMLSKRNWMHWTSCFECDLHVNWWAWIIFYSIWKLSSPFDEILRSCRICVCWRGRCFVDGGHVLHEDKCISSAPSHEIDIHFHYCSMCDGCARPYHVF